MQGKKCLYKIRNEWICILFLKKRDMYDNNVSGDWYII